MSMELGPYTNFHELNQDWFLNEFNKVLKEWADMQKSFTNLNQAFNDLHDYVHDYFKNLNVQKEIDNKLDAMADSGELGIILSKSISIGQPFFVNDVSQMTDTKALYVLVSNGMIYSYKDTSFVATGLKYGSPENVAINQPSTQMTKFSDITTVGYTRITAENYENMSDKVGLPSGRFSGYLFNLEHAFQGDASRYQELLLFNFDYGFLTYRRVFDTAMLEENLKWSKWGVDKVEMFNYVKGTITKFKDINIEGYAQITLDIYLKMTDKTGLPSGNYSGILLNLNKAFNDANLHYQELTIFSSSTDKFSSYRRFFNYDDDVDAPWTNVFDNNFDPKIKYCALGDSRTKGKAVNYPEIIKKNLNFDVTNYGVSGSTIMPHDAEHENLLTITQQHTFNAYDVISIMYGRNDYKLNNPLGNYLDKTNATVMGCLYLSVVNIVNDNNKCNIVIFSPFNDFSYGEAPLYARGVKNSANYTLQELSDEIKKFCNYYQFKYVDLIETFPQIINRGNIPDGVHLTDDTGLASIVASEIY